MSLEQGCEDIEVSTDPPTCGACGLVVASKAQYIRTNCGHSFHKSCLSKAEKLRPYCPLCNCRLLTEPPTPSSTGVTTRAQAKTSTTHVRASEDNTASVPTSLTTPIGPENPVTVRPSELQDIISSIVTAQQTQLFANLSDQISRLVQTNIESRFSRLNVNGQSTSPAPVQSSIQSTSPRQMHTLPAVEERTFREMFGISLNNSQSQNHAQLNASRSGPHTSNNSSSSDLTSRPDKVLHIISNWRIKFSGSLNSISVENFIYRIEALTSQTLQGDFDLLCRNASSLFEGKAADWFWRYHRSVDSVCWNSLCKAMRQQYSDSRSDVDIRELIRDRKQKQGESFDNFYESVVELTDILKEPLSGSLLVEILRRNLLPEIQHEILNLKISSLQELRDVCRRREFFMQDVRRKHDLGFSKPNMISKRVSELDEVVLDNEVESLTDSTDQIAAIGFICWNCRQSGHRYQECLANRTVFCYGCGTPDTYKPNCKKCNPKN